MIVVCVVVEVVLVEEVEVVVVDEVEVVTAAAAASTLLAAVSAPLAAGSARGEAFAALCVELVSRAQRLHVVGHIPPLGVEPHAAAAQRSHGLAGEVARGVGVRGGASVAVVVVVVV